MKEEMIVEELIDDLEMIIWEMGVEKLCVTENFKLLGVRKFIVEYLRIEIENDTVMFCDDENILLHNNCVISGFISNRLINIYKHKTNKSFHYELVFQDGNVLITLN